MHQPLCQVRPSPPYLKFLNINFSETSVCEAWSTERNFDTVNHINFSRCSNSGALSCKSSTLWDTGDNISICTPLKNFSAVLLRSVLKYSWPHHARLYTLHESGLLRSSSYDSQSWVRVLGQLILTRFNRFSFILSKQLWIDRSFSAWAHCPAWSRRGQIPEPASKTSCSTFQACKSVDSRFFVAQPKTCLIYFYQCVR